MITNNKLYELITETVSQGNEALREQLKSQITEKAEQTRTTAQEIADRQSKGLNDLSELMKELENAVSHSIEMNNRNAKIAYEQRQQLKDLSESVFARIENIRNEMHNQLDNTEELINSKIENVRDELIEKMDSDLNMTLDSFRVVLEKISDVQKDTAIIMETLQLILTNMMLDKIDIKNIS